MADNLEERKARLTPQKKTNLPALLGVVLIGGMATGAGGLYYLTQDEERPISIPTSSSKEFQTSGTTGLTTVPTNPKFAPSEAGPSESELALRDEVEALRAELATLRNQGPEVDQTQIDALSTQLEKLQGDLEQQAKDLKTVTEQRDELQRSEQRLLAETDGLRMQLTQATEDSLAEMRAQEEEERRRAELDRRRAEAEQLRQRQITSSIDGISGRGNADEGRKYEGDEAFVRAGADAIRATQSQIIGAPSNTIIQGTMIEATLTTGINSALSGTITSTVSYDVWSFDMSRVLIPRGSQIFGRYSNEVALGQRRVLVAWDRLVTPDGQVVALDSYGADRLGRSGLTGRVNNRFAQRFGSAALISVMSALPLIAVKDSQSDAEIQVAENVSKDVQDNVGSVVEEYLKLAPIITVEHGGVIMIMVSNDLELF